MIRNRLGATFPLGAIIFGYLLILIALLIAIVSGYSLVDLFTGTLQFSSGTFVACLVLFLVGIALAWTHDGVFIDVVNQRVKVYTAILGIGLGEWKDLDKYPYLCILPYKKNKPMLLPAIFILFEPAGPDIVHDVYLVSANHYYRIMIKTFKEKERAIQYAKNIEAKIFKDFVKYNPGKLTHVKYIS